MKSLSTRELNRIVSHYVALAMTEGRDKPVHHAVATRLANQLKIEDSISALRSAEGVQS